MSRTQDTNHTFADLYTSGDYLKTNPSWHIGESPWKAREIMRLIARNSITPKTICEIGCGAGEILRLLQQKLESELVFSGYEISPQAFELCKRKENEKLHFKLQDIKDEGGVFFDLILVMDVLEHIENYFELLRDVKSKSQYKIFQLPLDISVRSVLRGHILEYRETYGHIHYFTKEIALRMLQDAGYEVLDYFYTDEFIPLPWDKIRNNPRLFVRKLLGKMKRALLRVPSNVLFTVNQDFAERLFGNWRLLILAT